MSVEVMEPSVEPAPWKKYHQSIISSLGIERLREARKQQDPVQLEAALAAAHRAGIPDSNADLLNAQHMLDVIHARQELVSAVRNGGREQLESAIANTEQRGRSIVREVQQEMMEARNKLLSWKRLHHPAKRVMLLNQKVLSELKSLNNPPENVKSVMTATMLLLGHDEQTATWGYIKKALANGLYQNLLTFDPGTLHPEIAARAKQILMEYNMEHVLASSSVGFTLYVWCMGNIDTVEQQHLEDGAFKPATIPRQREILKPHTPTKTPTKTPPSPAFGRRSRSFRRQRSDGDVLPAPLRVDDLTVLHKCLKPPQMIKELVKAFLLLLGHDEEATANYHYCLEKLALHSNRERGLVAQLAAFDVSRVAPGVAARAKEIVSQLPSSQMYERQCAASKSVYSWVMQTVATVEDAHKDDGLFVPASPAQQKLLFHPPPSPPATPRKPRLVQMPRDNSAERLKGALTEVKAMKSPPVMVLEVCKAVFLLNGHDESKTTWKYCINNLSPGLLTNEELDIHPEIAARARQIIPDSPDKVKSVSFAVCSLYQWCIKTIERVESEHGTDAAPASVRRQKQLLAPVRSRSPCSGSPRSGSPRSARSSPIPRPASRGSSVAGSDK